MAAKMQLNNFRFSVYIDADGTVTLTDLPPELREVAEALDPSHAGGSLCPISPSQQTTDSADRGFAREATAKDQVPGDSRS
jgi:hypothetical protein